MTGFETVVGAVLLAFAVFLVISVLMQHGKTHHLSGTIAGGAETFFGKEKGKTIDKMLSKVTSVVAVIFVIAVILLYVFQGTGGPNIGGNEGFVLDPNAGEGFGNEEFGNEYNYDEGDFFGEHQDDLIDGGEFTDGENGETDDGAGDSGDETDGEDIVD